MNVVITGCRKEDRRYLVTPITECLRYFFLSFDAVDILTEVKLYCLSEAEPNRHVTQLNVIITSKQRRFDIIMTLLLRRVSDGKITQKWQQPTKIKRLCLIYWKSGKAADRDASLIKISLGGIYGSTKGGRLCYTRWYRFYFDLHYHSAIDILPMIKYHKVSNIRRTKSQNWNDSHIVLKSSLPNPLKPGVKSRMKM